MDDLFLKIIAGEIPADIVYQDDLVTAFRDINPQAPVHILFVTNEHIRSAADIEPQHEAAVGRLFTAARKVAEQEGIAKSGYRLIMNSLDDAHQEVPHIHLHLLGGHQLGPMLDHSFERNTK